MENRSAASPQLQQLRHTIRTWWYDTTTTRSVCYFLIAWHLIIWLLPLDVTESTVEYWLLATANPSPGWMLAAFSHAGLAHLLTNTGLLIMFGATIERQLSTRQYLVFLLATGILTTLAQVLEYNLHNVMGAMVGASGASFAVTAFTLVTLYRTSPSDYTLEHTSTINYRPGKSLAALVLIVGQLINDWTPYLSIAPKASGIGHLTGILLGALTAILTAKT
ncbi:rhomboid family intramembrane serine protease [Halobacterium salinarum]|uniref:rhomboid family intramembrane serine protease n=1 Tax=Halobacterium salinarum TaxID=2242 RepID=UPI002556E3B6|nr:rhomboid family intramembrane serine protease [Halobacterium salinarum]MDL0131243.1 rhomboid family intramembrane serine protease [Halobacterium salinarum]